MSLGFPDIRLFNRIAIVGTGGSGKSTLARRLSVFTGIPVYHMDSLFWAPGWVERPPEDWRKEESSIIAQEQWIIEGYIDPRFPERLQKAHLIIDLDLSGIVCAWNGLKRWARHRRTPRPELQGSPEKLDWAYIRVMLFKRERADVDAALETIDAGKIIRVTSKKDFEVLCHSMP